MKLIRKKKDSDQTNEPAKVTPLPWKILIVDDEPDVHTITGLVLKNFEFAGKKLQIFKAMSGTEAREILTTEPHIAVALIDIVMETDDAGLQLVDFIRKKLNNTLIRLIIRTGQPGMAPEKEVINRYDIDDYKDKTELTAQKLYTTLRLALKSYRDLGALDSNQKGLKKILDAVPELYHPQSTEKFFTSVLSKILSLCLLSENDSTSTVSSALVLNSENKPFYIQYGTGRFAKLNDNSELETILRICSDYQSNQNAKTDETLLPGTFLIPLKGYNDLLGFVYLEGVHYLSKVDKDLIYIMANQCATALENLQLYLDLKEANRQTSYMLTLANQARKMAEAANHAKSTFLAKMSHELRTPLNAILGYSDMIQEEAADFGCEDLLPDLDKVQVAGKQLLDIISNILDISKIEADKLELNLTEFKVSELVEEVVTTLQPIIKIEGHLFQVKCDGELGKVYADYHKVRQIMFNLLNNAIKFTTQGTITFTISRQKIPTSLPSIPPVTEESRTENIESSESDWLFFQVADTGIGIEAEKLQIIFEAFTQEDNSTTRKYDGSGLGLTISEHFCRAMGGSISVCSTVGEGSIFAVQLPARVSRTDV